MASVDGGEGSTPE